MKKMGIRQEDIDASEVIIKTPEKNIIIRNPEVSKINMGGQETFQIAGDVSEEAAEPEISKEDLQTVMEQADCSEEEARDALEESRGDLAEAILKLKNS